MHQFFDSIEVFSYGADKPVASNDTEEGRSANRRVDVYIKAAQEASAE
jgi:flagellar motor protein MotB